MERIVRVAAAQMGPIAREESRAEVVQRLVALLRKAKSFGAELVVYPELALTTFFPRWAMENPEAADGYFETAMPNPAVQPLFDEAKALGIGFYLGYAELAEEEGRRRRFNSALLVERDGRIIGNYRKVHIPGYKEQDAAGLRTNFEKRFFENGDLGFPVFEGFGGTMGMLLCNDRRWPESYRVMALQGVELVMVGYNTGAVRRNQVGNHAAALQPAHQPSMHNHLVMRAGAYQNCCWVVGVAKAGYEEGEDLLGQTCIIAPSGDIVAMAVGVGDEVVVADCDLEAGRPYRETIFNFEANRRIEHYGLITQRR
ncbi:N-carbamoyl-D-amino-acid hydrolase [Roseomonas sp. OT10]|uniref:N-carbamoyl-D-amino-acid hydrolase n=1 Tax=Roseomonas cutis TaxID=2897332 RepID=UPI001E4FBF16|nr:N-carbamoyl-D-amino-acid hydrolase [Roseomonas sp. OT10]UFN48398.1 N-carbamoyl-D-amino-acid hydrolase [Roseomonas sp. OT10]